MTVFYFIRHGQADFTEADTNIYQGQGFHLLTLSEAGVRQIKAAARDERLREAQLIITSPFGRTLHSAAILSRELGLDLQVETGLHEWLADGVDFSYLPQEEADRRGPARPHNQGPPPPRATPRGASAEQMKARVFAVLDKYRDCRCVIAVCHGTLMEYVLDIPHPSNGQIVRFEF